MAQEREKVLWVNPYGWLDLNHSTNGVNGVAQEGIKRLKKKGLDIVTVGPHVGNDKYNVADVILGNTIQLPRRLAKITGTGFPVSLPFRKEYVSQLILNRQPDGLFIEQPDQGFAGHSFISGAQIGENRRLLIPIMTRFHAGIYDKHLDFLYRSLIKSLKLTRRPRGNGRGFTEGIANTVLDNFQLYLVTSEAIRRASERRYGKKEYKPLSNGIDADRFAPEDSEHPVIKEWRNDEKEIVLIAMGRIEKRKGVMYGLEAYKIIKAQRPNTKLMIAGDGAERKSLEQKVESEGIGDVHFRGMLSREEYAMALRTADVGIYPAIGGEGWGLVVGEGLASGLLSVVSNIEGYNEVTDGGRPFALMAEPRNPADIARKALEILNLSQGERQNLKWQAAEYIRSRFAWDIIINQLAGYIQTVLDNGAKVDWGKARERYAKKHKFFPPSGTLFDAKR